MGGFLYGRFLPPQLATIALLTNDSWNQRCAGRVVVDTGARVNHCYPPDKQEKATQTVLEQAELLGAEWAEAVSS